MSGAIFLGHEEFDGEDIYMYWILVPDYMERFGYLHEEQL